VGSPLKKIKWNAETYRPPGKLEIPAEVVEVFWALGYELKWVRVTKNNNQDLPVPDVDQIRKRRAQHFIPVTHTELRNHNLGMVSEIWEHSPGGELFTNLKDWVLMGDTALFKREHVIAQAHRDYEVAQAFERASNAIKIAGSGKDYARGTPGTNDSNIKLRKGQFRIDEPITDQEFETNEMDMEQED
jgi:hypothetical protein